MVDDPYVKDGRVIIRSSVEMLYGGEDVVYYSLSVDEWSKMTKHQQDTLCGDIAVEHQNNVAPCAASCVPWSEVRDDEEILPYD